MQYCVAQDMYAGDAGAVGQYVMARNTLMTTLMQVRQFSAVGQCTTALDTLAKTQVQWSSSAV